MAIVNPQLPIFDRAQTGSVVVTLATPTDVSSWTVIAYLRAYNGGTALATLTVGSGITVTSSTQGIWTLVFSTTQLNQEPGSYVWDFQRTNTGAEFEIVEPSGFIIRDNTVTGNPKLTNLSEYMAYVLNSMSLANNDPYAKHIVLSLASAEDHLRRWCNRDFVYKASQTEYYSGNGTQYLYLRRWPVTFTSGITSVKLDYAGNFGSTSGSFDSNTALTSGVDYCLIPSEESPQYGTDECRGVLFRINGVWPLQGVHQLNYLAAQTQTLPGCIQVVYSGGFQLIPYSLKQAVWDLATFISQRSATGRLPQSESGEGYSVGYGPLDAEMRMIGSVNSVINTFQRLYPE